MISAILMIPVLIFIDFLITPAASADCSCQCMSGAPRTVCTTLNEARVKPSLCKQRMNCPPVTSRQSAEWQEDSKLKQQFSAPEKAAQNCRSRYFWDPVEQDYAILAKVCDVDEPEDPRDT